VMAGCSWIMRSGVADVRGPSSSRRVRGTRLSPRVARHRHSRAAVGALGAENDLTGKALRSSGAKNWHEGVLDRAAEIAAQPSIAEQRYLVATWRGPVIATGLRQGWCVRLPDRQGARHRGRRARAWR
jgi:hypothetical protein